MKARRAVAAIGAETHRLFQVRQLGEIIDLDQVQIRIRRQIQHVQHRPPIRRKARRTPRGAPVVPGSARAGC